MSVLRTTEPFIYEMKITANKEEGLPVWQRFNFVFLFSNFLIFQTDFDALIFNVVSSMFLQRSTSIVGNQSQLGLRWTVDGQTYAFFFTSSNSARDRELAEVTLLNCIYESEYRRSHNEAKREELTQFISNENNNNNNNNNNATSTTKSVVSASSSTSSTSTPTKQINSKITSPTTTATNSSSTSTAASSSKLTLPKFSVDSPLAGKLVRFVCLFRCVFYKPFLYICSVVLMLQICISLICRRMIMCQFTATSQFNCERSK